MKNIMKLAPKPLATASTAHLEAAMHKLTDD